MANDDKDAVIEKLLARIDALEARVGPDPAAEVPVLKDWPRMVHRRGHLKGQIDHPGVLQLKVQTPDALAEALENGWQEEPLEPLDHDDAEALIPVKAKAKAKAKAA